MSGRSQQRGNLKDDGQLNKTAQPRAKTGLAFAVISGAIYYSA
ncbi:hypothetical protein [Xenorhabdus sp. PB30.3]|nr:hypothetical protein [Xenorhabdus sp. PB30.3]